MSSALGKEMFLGSALDSKQFSLDDNTDISFDDLPPGAINGIARGWIPDNDGTLSILNPAGKVVPVPCKQGGVYPWPAKRFRSTGTSGVTAVTAAA